MKNDRLIIEKQKEIIEHLKAYYDAQESPAVKLIEPQWHNYLTQLHAELSALEQEPEEQPATGIGREELRSELIKLKEYIDEIPTVYNVFPNPEDLLTNEQFIDNYLSKKDSKQN
jgi:hypothetical protein